MSGYPPERSPVRVCVCVCVSLFKHHHQGDQMLVLLNFKAKAQKVVWGHGWGKGARDIIMSV